MTGKKTTSTSTQPVWADETSFQTRFESLKKNVKSDVVVIGGGITGVNTAYLLAKKNLSVVLLEKRSLISGMTSMTTAFVTKVIDADLQAISKAYGKDFARKVWQSGQNALEIIEEIIAIEKIECSFLRVPAVIYTSKKEDKEKLKKETELAQELGFQAEFSTTSAYGFKTLATMQVPDQAKFQPLEYVTGVAEAAAKNGVQIYEETDVQEINETKDSVTVHTKTGRVIAKHVVIATHFPIVGPAVQVKLLPYISYVIAAEIPSGLIKQGIYWDTDSPYHYFRVDNLDNQDLIILGGEDHKSGHPPKENPYQSLENYLKKLLPGSLYKVTHRWGGQVANTIDGLPYIGALPFTKRQYVATGYNGTGMVYSMVAALLISDLIQHRTSKFEKIYSPLRIRGGLLELSRHGIEAGIDFAKGYLLQKNKRSIEDLSVSDGQIMSINGKKVAVYKDSKGNILKLSAKCTHLGCIVGWNSIEKTWDCPCHGSRFTKEGEVLVGPATQPLKEV